MKKYLLLLLVIGFGLSAQDQDQILIMQSPSKFIDNEALATCAQAWAEKYVKPLNEAEVKVVARLLHVGKVFSGIDLQMRTLIQSMLKTVCSLYQVVNECGDDPRLAQEVEAEVQEFTKLKGIHAFMFHEWQAWANVLSVAENKQVKDAIEAVNDAIRTEIEKALSHKEWQVLAARVPSSAQGTIKTLTLLTNLCQATAQQDEGNEQKEAAGSTVDPVVLFDMVLRAAELGCQNSFKTVEAASQLLVYEAMLLEMSYIMFGAYLEAIQGKPESSIEG